MNHNLNVKNSLCSSLGLALDWPLTLSRSTTASGGTKSTSLHVNCRSSKTIWSEWIQTFATLIWTKVFICLPSLRIPITKRLVLPMQAALVIVVVSNVVLTILWIVQCHPVAAAWNQSFHGTCFSKDQRRCIVFAQGSSFAIPNCFSDDLVRILC